jgi:hypothetical protein
MWPVAHPALAKSMQDDLWSLSVSHIRAMSDVGLDGVGNITSIVKWEEPRKCSPDGSKENQDLSALNVIITLCI